MVVAITQEIFTLKSQIKTNSLTTSDKTNVKWASTSVRDISTGSLFLTIQIIFENATQKNHPKIIHQTTMQKNDKNQLVNTAHPVVHSSITHRTTKNKARAVPSLKRLSHSNMSVSLLGAHRLLKIERTATGSVAETRDQKSKHTKNGISKPKNGKIKKSQKAIKKAEIKSHIIARPVMDFQFLRRCL